MLLTVVLIVVWSIAVGLDPAGSVALGVTWLVIGLSWVGVTAVAAQLTSSTRGTAGWSLGALAVAFLVRAVGDTAAADSPARFLSWLTPLGWGVKVSPFGENRYWIVGARPRALRRPRRRRLRAARPTRPRGRGAAQPGRATSAARSPRRGP